MTLLDPTLTSAARLRQPPLQTGDRLTHAEFMARYEALPEDVKAERIEGIVYMPAAALSAEFHGRPHAHLMGWLTVYQAATPGVDVLDNSTTFLDADNDPQPDACLRILETHGGASRPAPGGYVEGSPELIVEVAASSASIDLGDKFKAYRRNGVREYLVVRTYDVAVDWFVLRDGRYVPMQLDGEGLYRSECFPGLWLHADSLLAGRSADLLAHLHRGIADPAHAAFVAQLQAAAARPRA